MNVFNSVKSRTPARSLADIDVPDSVWKPDFDIVDRYQNFANEMMRVSLLGIAGYGFLLKEFCLNEKPRVSADKMLTMPAMVGLLFLVCCLIGALVHRFYSTSCLFYQVLIIRSLKRLENDHWSTEEKNIEHEFLKGVREKQRSESRASNWILALTAFFFGLGFFCMIPVVFQFFN